MTKKKLAVITCASVAMLTGAIVLATSLQRQYEMEFRVGNQEYIVNGTVKQFDEETENLPLVDQWTGRLLMPLRCVMEEMGGSLRWDQEKQSTEISFKGNSIILKEGDKKASINGNSIVLDMAPKNINGCLYVTSDFISNNFGTEIEWQEDQNQIIIKTEAGSRPIVSTNLLEYDEISVDYAVEIPVITGLNDKNYEQSLNHSFMQNMMEEIQSFVTEAEAKKTTLQKGERYVWEGKVYVFERRNELISLMIDHQISDPLKGNRNDKQSFNIDLQSQKTVSLNDLFKNKKYKEALWKELEAMITTDPEEYKKLNTKEITGEEAFAIHNGNLVLFLKDSSGEYIRFQIPFANLKKYLKSDYVYLIAETKKES